MANGRKVPLDLERAVFKEDNKTDLVYGIQAITNMLKLRNKQLPPNSANIQALPNVITFPYSRHSSYPELCNLVNTFKPRDVWPCTVDVPRWLLEGLISPVSSGYQLLR